MGASKPSRAPDHGVSEYEGIVLGAIARTQPVTRYQLLKTLEKAPTTSYNSSKGSFYPLVGRMIDKGLLCAEPGVGTRKSENLRLTDAGREALRSWILATEHEKSFGHDPLLSRLQSLADVPIEKRVEWIAAAKQSLLEKKDELDSYHQNVELPYGDIVHGAAAAMIQAKLEWLDRLLIHLVQQPPQT